MHDDLTKYFDRLDARAIDPNETVEIDGRERRVIDVHRTVQKQRRNKKYYDKNQAKGRSQTAAWKAANPAKVIAQKTRMGDRKYHRPFIGIDAEGQNFPGHDEVDKQGNVYPLHRTILWGAGGWKRLHTSTELAAGFGLPTLGKECPSYFLGSENKKALDPIDIIEWLLTLPDKYDPENGFPHGVNLAAFSFNYDVTQILAGFSRQRFGKSAGKNHGKRRGGPEPLPTSVTMLLII